MARAAPPWSPLFFFPAVAAVVVGVGGGAVCLVLADVGGFQFRKEVQTLQGLPSGPRTVPGGRGRAVWVEPVDFPVEVLVLLLIVGTRRPGIRAQLRR